MEREETNPWGQEQQKRERGGGDEERVKDTKKSELGYFIDGPVEPTSCWDDEPAPFFCPMM